ncbi:MAG: Crp/Fnr family transcriptional regulator [Aridibacter sp.]
MALVQKLEELGRTKTFSKGEQIFGAGEKAEFLPVVLKGRIKVVRFLEVGKEIILNVFNDGEIFAIPPILDGKTYPATAVAMEETKLLLIYKKDFHTLLEESDEFSGFIMSRMSSLMREITSSMENLATASPEKRVGKILVRLANKENPNDSIKIPIRRQDIAEMAGLTTETTIRATRRLADKNLIKIVHGKIILEGTDNLQKFLDS